MLGKKIEKSIRYDEKLDCYYVQFTFASMKGSDAIRSFPTLEDARTYRDTINAEKLKYKINRDLEKFYNKDKEELESFNIKNIYPLNILDALKLEAEIDPIFYEEEEFEKTLAKLNKREEECIKKFYKERKTLQNISEEYGITKERIRQILVKALKKVRYYMLKYKADQALKSVNQLQEKNLQDLKEKRERILQEFLKRGVYTEEMKMTFGEIKPDLGYENTEDSIYDLDFSVRTFNCLRRGGIRTLNQLRYKTIEELSQIRCMGNKSIREIETKLAAHGIHLKSE